MGLGGSGLRRSISMDYHHYTPGACQSFQSLVFLENLEGIFIDEETEIQIVKYLAWKDRPVVQMHF